MRRNPPRPLTESPEHILNALVLWPASCDLPATHTLTACKAASPLASRKEPAGGDLCERLCACPVIGVSSRPRRLVPCTSIVSERVRARDRRALSADRRWLSPQGTCRVCTGRYEPCTRHTSRGRSPAPRCWPRAHDARRGSSTVSTHMRASLAPSATTRSPTACPATMSRRSHCGAGAYDGAVRGHVFNVRRSCVMVM